MTESSVHSARESFTFERKCVALRNRGVERFSRLFHLLVARGLGKLLAGRQRLVGDPRAGAGDGLVQGPVVGPGADLFAVVGHGEAPSLSSCMKRRLLWIVPALCCAVSGRRPYTRP